MEIKPRVFLIGETRIRYDELAAYLEHIGVPDWDSPSANSDAEQLAEVYGRICYKSFDVSLNPNLTRIHTGNEAFLQNIIKQRHGSVLESIQTNWVFADVSRVLCMELIRHRAGCAISQESLR
ncbi:MAG: FAD-dependent thymidylate synthase, partial [Nanoarchaeota archaeon]|nr:FAD-dependent thymidylate synthase [Nanoarchaeota archaeon]